MTSKGYSNDIKVRCSSWVVAVIMGVCLSDPAKVSLFLFLSHTHRHTYMLAPGPDGITLCGREERLESLVDSAEGGGRDEGEGGKRR